MSQDSRPAPCRPVRECRQEPGAGCAERVTPRDRAAARQGLHISRGGLSSFPRRIVRSAWPGRQTCTTRSSPSSPVRTTSMRLGAEEEERLRRGHRLGEARQDGGVGHLHGPAGDPDVAVGHLGVGSRVGLDGEARVAPQVERLAGARHHAEPQLVQPELRLQAGDAGEPSLRRVARTWCLYCWNRFCTVSAKAAFRARKSCHELDVMGPSNPSIPTPSVGIRRTSPDRMPPCCNRGVLEGVEPSPGRRGGPRPR